MHNVNLLLRGARYGICFFGNDSTVISFWKIFEKADRRGWMSLVPIYSLIVLLEISGKPLWWILLFMIPLVNLVVAFLVMAGLAKKFSKDIGFAAGLLLLGFIFFPILAFDDSVYDPDA